MYLIVIPVLYYVIESVLIFLMCFLTNLFVYTYYPDQVARPLTGGIKYRFSEHFHNKGKGCNPKVTLRNKVCEHFQLVLCNKSVYYSRLSSRLQIYCYYTKLEIIMATM